MGVGNLCESALYYHLHLVHDMDDEYDERHEMMLRDHLHSPMYQRGIRYHGMNNSFKILCIMSLLAVSFRSALIKFLQLYLTQLGKSLQKPYVHKRVALRKSAISYAKYTDDKEK